MNRPGNVHAGGFTLWTLDLSETAAAPAIRGSAREQGLGTQVAADAPSVGAVRMFGKACWSLSACLSDMIETLLDFLPKMTQM